MRWRYELTGGSEMRGKRVKALREALRQASILGGPIVSLKHVKRNHQGERKTWTKPATATGYFCSRPAARARKASIAAKFDREHEAG